MPAPNRPVGRLVGLRVCGKPLTAELGLQPAARAHQKKQLYIMPFLRWLREVYNSLHRFPYIAGSMCCRFLASTGSRALPLARPFLNVMVQMLS